MDKIYKGEYKITSPFGPRSLNGDERPHKGEDYVGITDKIVVSPTLGKVVSSQIITDRNNATWEWGNYVKIDNLNGYYLFFCHLSARLVKVGDKVEEGQPIGIEGNTGYSFGSHCHFEVRRKSDGVSINPREYFKILAVWEKSQIDVSKKLVQEKTGFDNNTMEYLSKHPYSDALFLKLTNAMK